MLEPTRTAKSTDLAEDIVTMVRQFLELGAMVRIPGSHGAPHPGHGAGLAW